MNVYQRVEFVMICIINLYIGTRLEMIVLGTENVRITGLDVLAEAMMASPR